MSDDMLFPRHREDVLHVRAISDELIDARPDRYRSFEEGDWETFARLMRLDLSQWEPSKVSAWKGKVTSSGGGIVISRFDAWGGQTPPPYARFDREVYFDDKGKLLHYGYQPNYGTEHYDTKRIDIHPLARSPEVSAEGVLYFCLEGSLKADAVLSAGRPAISSTSVTTWEGHDLKKLVPELKDAKRVYVVADSDFYESDKFGGYFNPYVVYSTRRAAQYLRYRGVDVKIAVPWTGTERAKVGVDDFLFQGHELERLTLEDPIPDAVHLLPSLPVTKDQERILRYLLKYGGGRFGAFFPHKVAEALHVDRHTVRNAYLRFEELEIMKVRPARPELAPVGWRVMHPHSFIAFALVHGFKDWLRSIPVPAPVRQKLGMDQWTS